MIGGVAFDLYVGQFTAGEVAEVCGVSRPVVDMWGVRGFLSPTRREQTTRPGRPRKKAGKPKASKGRPLFSARDIFKARLMRVLALQLGLGLNDSVLVAAAAEKEKIDESNNRSVVKDAAGIAEKLADLEWQWAVARSIERGQPMFIYAYTTREGEAWRLDMHVGRQIEPPSFGWDVPYIYIPVSEIFAFVYAESKKLLGLSDPNTVGEDG
jgi:hypothetical protein